MARQRLEPFSVMLTFVFGSSTAAPGGAGVAEGGDLGAVDEAEGADPGTRLAEEHPHRDTGESPNAG